MTLLQAVVLLAALGPGAGDLDGTWRLVTVAHEGRDVPHFAGWLFRVRDGRLEVKPGWQGPEEHPADPGFLRGSRLRLDPSAAPHTIDFELSPGIARGVTLPGIYQVRGDRLLIAVRTLLTAGQPRPKGYATESGRLITLTLQRLPAAPAEAVPGLAPEGQQRLREAVEELRRLKPPGMHDRQWRGIVVEMLNAPPGPGAPAARPARAGQ